MSSRIYPAPPCPCLSPDCTQERIRRSRDTLIATAAAGFTIAAILLMPLLTYLALLLGGHL